MPDPEILSEFPEKVAGETVLEGQQAEDTVTMAVDPAGQDGYPETSTEEIDSRFRKLQVDMATALNTPQKSV